jgi:predicted nucleic acid-binding protein
MPIIDSSTLISFAKIQKLAVLTSVKGKIITIGDVYEECVEEGINLGYGDALRIKKMFDDKTITIEKVKKPEAFSGVSKIDAKIISLAKEKKDYLFADDVKVGRRARAEHITVRNTPDILIHLMKTKRMAKAECKESLQKLVDHKRLSEKTRKLYEKAGGL